MEREVIVLGKDDILEKMLENNSFRIVYVIENEDTELEQKKGDLLVINNKELIGKYNSSTVPALFCVDNRDEAEDLFENCSFIVFDYILKPYHEHEVIDRIERLLKMEKYRIESSEAEKKYGRIVQMLREVNNINRKLMIKAQSLEEESLLDPLSNVYNRKYTMKRLDEEIGRTQRYERQFAICLIDIVHIREINEEYGHIAGDETISRVSRIIEDSVRTSDIVGRIRGSTFLVILPEIVEKYSIKVIERIVENIENIKIKDIKLDGYAGFAIIDRARLAKFSTSTDLMLLLDKLIIFAKQAGKQIVEYNDDSIESIQKIKEFVMNNELEEKHNIILEELAKSKKFIERLLPKKEEWDEIMDYSYLYFPFNFIGGDFFDYTLIDDKKIAILFCDVSGHGVSAALYITAIKYIFRNLVHKDNIINPSEFMNSFNKGILELAEQNVYVATTYGILDIENRKFSYSYGGGTIPMKIDKHNNEIVLLADGGYVVGLFEEAEFETKEIEFNEGDYLFFYSDGIYEFLIENRLMKDESEFHEVVKKSLEKSNETEFLNSLYSLVQEKMDEEADFNDDITILAIKIK